MLPKNSPTERTLYLRGLVDAATPEELARWPNLTNDDYALVGKYIAVYAYLDFNLRRIAEAVDRAGELPASAKGKKAAYLSIGQVEEAVQAIPEIRDEKTCLLSRTSESFAVCATCSPISMVPSDAIPPQSVP